MNAQSPSRRSRHQALSLLLLLLNNPITHPSPTNIQINPIQTLNLHRRVTVLLVTNTKLPACIRTPRPALAIHRHHHRMACIIPTTSQSCHLQPTINHHPSLPFLSCLPSFPFPTTNQPTMNECKFKTCGSR